MIGRGHLPQSNELLAFEAAARHQSFTRAAIELSLTQGAISRSVALLEQRLGIRLFERVRQRVLLTPVGNAYLREVSPLLAQLREATRHAMAWEGGTRRLSVAVLPTLGMRWLIPRLPDFLEDRAGTTVDLVTRPQPFDLAGQQIDVALHHGGPEWPGAVTRLLMHETMVPVADPAYRAARGIHAPSDLAGATLLHQSTRPMAWAQWHEVAGLPTQGALRGPTFDQYGMILEAMIAGLGCGILPLFLVSDDLAKGRLVELWPTHLVTGSGYYVVTPEVTFDLAQQFAGWLIGLLPPG